MAQLHAPLSLALGLVHHLVGGADEVEVHLHLLADERELAAATADVVKPAPPVQKRAPKVLPLTGAEDMTILAIVLIIAAAGALAMRRRFNS